MARGDYAFKHNDIRSHHGPGLSREDPDPLEEFETENGSNINSFTVHIRIQQRSGRKTLTTIQGIDDKFDLKKIARVLKKEFACNGTIIIDPEYGEVIQLTGDQRKNCAEFLDKTGIVKKDQIQVHGF